jgi:hypothetical protein
VTFDRVDGKISSYINGIKVGESAVTFGTPSYSGKFYVGRDTVAGTYFNGYIDEVRIYTRAFTQIESLGLYDLITPNTFRDLDLNLNFEGTYNDTSSNGYSVSAVGGTLSFGAFGQGLYLNGSSYLTTGCTAKAVDTTLSAIINPTSIQSNSYTGSPIIDSQYPANSGLGYGISTSSIGVVFPNSFDSSSTYSFLSNHWYSVVVIFSYSTDQIKTYVNGTLVKTINQTIGNNPFFGNYSIGRDARHNINFIGYIDNVKIFNRILRTDEIKLLKTSDYVIPSNPLENQTTTPEIVLDQNLALYYNFDGNAKDQTKFRTGTISGGIILTTGITGGAGSFTGSNYIDTNLNSYVSNWTLSTYFKANSFSSNSYLDSPLISCCYS